MEGCINLDESRKAISKRQSKWKWTASCCTVLARFFSMLKASHKTLIECMISIRVSLKGMDGWMLSPVPTCFWGAVWLFHPLGTDLPAKKYGKMQCPPSQEEISQQTSLLHLIHVDMILIQYIL